MPRCPDCNKFVSLENGQPEADDIKLEFHMRDKAGHPHFDVTSSAHATRNCADCGTTLKELNMDLSGVVLLRDFEGWDKLDPSQQGDLVGLLDAGTVEPNVEDNDASAEDAGGSRYKKNIITVTVSYTITIEDLMEHLGVDIKLVHNGELVGTAAAGEFEEC